MVGTVAIADGITQPLLRLTASQADRSFICSHLKNVGFAQVYGSNHFPHFERTAQAQTVIETFLSWL